VSRRERKPAHHVLSYLPSVVGDLDALEQVDPALAAAALAALDDLAYGRQRGKALGERHVTGDLTGLLRLRFDVSGARPPRFRIVYRLVENDTVAEVIAVAARAGHTVYQVALTRLDDPTDPF
jgi:hypothetical protein